jgi:hypothetical protein
LSHPKEGLCGINERSSSHSFSYNGRPFPESADCAQYIRQLPDTLTEVPILQGLIGSGMGEGPALALLLAGPALSLPNMLVIRSVIGTKKTAVYVSLVVIVATFSGVIYGTIFV